MAEGIRRVSNAEHFIVDVEDDGLIVDLPTKRVNEVNKLVCFLAGPAALQVPRFRDARNRVSRESRHKKRMRFELSDPQRRLFEVECWCFQSWYEGWIHLAASASLFDLVEQYAEHLGEESFYELY